MMRETPPDDLQHERICTDRVVHRPGYLVVYASMGMPDWREPGFRKTMVVFRDVSYFVRSADPLGGSRWRYALEPWPAGSTELPLRVIRYGEDYIKLRDASVSRPVGCVGLLVVLMAPLLGFVPRRVKAVLQSRFQLNPLSITRYSIITGWAFVLNGAYWIIRDQCGGAAAGVPQWVLLLGTAGLILLPDLLVRTLHWWQENPQPFGLYEWLCPGGPDHEATGVSAPPASPDPDAETAGPARSLPDPAPDDAEPASVPLLRTSSGEPELGPATPIAAYADDRVYREPEGLLVIARNPLPDWRVKRHRKTQVIIADARYHVTEVTRTHEGLSAYRLRLWRADDPDIPGHVCHYTPDLVRERDEWIRRGRRNIFYSFLVWLAAPALGWLPSSFQARIEERFGLDARAAVRYSLLLQAGLLVVLFIRGVLGLAGRGRAIPTPAGISLEWLLFIALTTDAVLRMIPLLEGRPDPPGLFEWLWRRRRR